MRSPYSVSLPQVRSLYSKIQARANMLFQVQYFHPPSAPKARSIPPIYRVLLQQEHSCHRDYFHSDSVVFRTIFHIRVRGFLSAKSSVPKCVGLDETPTMPESRILELHERPIVRSLGHGGDTSLLSLICMYILQILHYQPNPRHPRSKKLIEYRADAPKTANAESQSYH